MPLLRRILGAPNVQKHLEKRDVAKLINDLRDENASVRAQAATALGKLGDSKAAPALIAAYEDEDHAVTDAITSALGAMGPEIFPLLAPLIIAGQVWTRGDKGARAAIRTIASRDFDKAAGALRGLIGHTEWRVRLAAKEAIIPNGTAATRLAIDALSDERFEARVVAAGILAALATPEGVDPLIKVLGDENPEVRQAAAEALGNIGARRAVDGLIALVKDPTEPPQNAVVVALGKLRSPKAVQPLVELLDTTTDDRLIGNIADALRTIGDVAAAKALRSALEKTHDVETRESLFSAMAALHDPSSKEMLLSEIVFEEKRLKRRAQLNAQEFKLVTSLVGSLALVGGDDVIAALTERLESPLSFDVVDGPASQRFYPIRDAARTALILMGRHPGVSGSAADDDENTTSGRFEVKS
jgi:HEAT repeat protein